MKSQVLQAPRSLHVVMHAYDSFEKCSKQCHTTAFRKSKARIHDSYQQKLEDVKLSDDTNAYLKEVDALSKEKVKHMSKDKEFLKVYTCVHNACSNEISKLKSMTIKHLKNEIVDSNKIIANKNSNAQLIAFHKQLIKRNTTKLQKLQKPMTVPQLILFANGN